jgi:hypothetical protein
MNPAAIAWIILGTFIILYVGGYDTWAHFTQHYTMTHEMDVWLQNHVSGPFVMWFWAGAPFAWAFHLWQSRGAKL